MFIVYLPIYLPNPYSQSSYDHRLSCQQVRFLFSLHYLQFRIHHPTYLTTSTEKSEQQHNTQPQIYRAKHFLCLRTFYKNKQTRGTKSEQMDVSLFGPIYDSKAVPEIKVWVIKQTTCTLMEFLQITKTLQRLSKKTLLEQNVSILFKINTYFKIYHWERTFGSVTNQHFDFNL